MTLRQCAIVDAVGPAIDVAVPLAARKRAEQILIQHPRVARHRFEHRQRVLRVGAQTIVETFQTDVTLATLCERVAELQAGALREIRQIAQHDLLLQRDGRGCDDETFAERFGDRNRGDAIRRGFAGAGAGFDRRDAPLAVAARQHARDRCDHFALAATWLEFACAEPRAVRELDALFQRVVEGGVGHRL